MIDSYNKSTIKKIQKVATWIYDHNVDSYKRFLHKIAFVNYEIINKQN